MSGKCETCGEPTHNGVCLTSLVNEAQHGRRAPDVWIDLLRFGMETATDVSVRLLTGRKADYFADD